MKVWANIVDLLYLVWGGRAAPFSTLRLLSVSHSSIMLPMFLCMICVSLILRTSNRFIRWQTIHRFKIKSCDDREEYTERSTRSSAVAENRATLHIIEKRKSYKKVAQLSLYAVYQTWSFFLFWPWVTLNKQRDEDSVWMHYTVSQKNVPSLTV